MFKQIITIEGMDKLNMNLGFTGTRSTVNVIGTRLATLDHHFRYLVDSGYNALHHGDCIGMDALAHELGVLYEYLIYIHPPINNKYRAFKDRQKRDAWVSPPKPYRQRNQEIVDASDYLIAVPEDPNNINPRSGTSMTINMAKRKGIPVMVI